MLRGQTINDPCFTSPSIGTSFAGTANISNNNSDLLNWTGSAWTGGWGGAAITLAPPGSVAGTRAIWTGDGVVWTTGGEGFGLRLSSGITTGVTYSYSYTRVSHGTGSSGSYAPRLYTNTGGSFGYNVAAIPAAGTSWFTGVISFTAVAAQSGHTYIYFHSASGGGSGMFLACLSVVLPMQLWDFYGWENEGKCYLEWKADDEDEFRTHIIERSADGVTFEEAGSVSIEHPGKENHYSFSEKGEGRVWYRIRSLNLNGESAFSPVIEISSASGADQISGLHPNPVTAGETVWVEVLSQMDQRGEVMITDLSGRVMNHYNIQLRAGKNQPEIPTAGLAAGSYLLTITGETFSRTQPFLVRN